MTDDDARIRGLEDDFEADMAARYEGAGDPGIHVTSIVDAAYSDLYDEIMNKAPAERTIAEEAFIEHVAERLVAEVADEPRWFTMDLDADNVADLMVNVACSLGDGHNSVRITGTELGLLGIVDNDAGGIVAYAIGDEHANRMVDALNEVG